ncbi:MAG TPA: c-type cytochrome [Gemmatimonadaceae bacterium]
MARIVTGRNSGIRLATILATVALLGACDRADDHLSMMVGGDAARGRTVIKKYGCNTCHTISGVRGADGLVGPPLNGIASRMYIGGVTTNTPQHMISWIENPKQFDSKTAMPNVGVTHRDAIDIASYLYTLK